MSNITNRTVYVGGLHDDVNRDILQATFAPFGEIKTVEIPLDKVSGKHRAFGFVEFRDAEDIDAAIDNMHESELFGRTIRVNLARATGNVNRPGLENNRPIWADDFFHKKKMMEAGLDEGNL